MSFRAEFPSQYVRLRDARLHTKSSLKNASLYLPTMTYLLELLGDISSGQFQYPT